MEQFIRLLSMIPEFFIRFNIMDTRQIELIQLNAEVARLTSENHQLRSEVCPDIQSITHELLMAGLIEWGDAAIKAYNLSHLDGADSVTPLILELHKVAMETRSSTQCDRMKELFVTIATRANIWPTSDQAKSMQAILDKGCPSTGPVSPDKLSFQPWI